MLNRRELLLSGCAAGAFATLPTLADQPVVPRSPELARLFQAFFQENLRLHPEGATQLGLDKGPNAPLRARLTRTDAAARDAAKVQTEDQLRRLIAVDRARLSPADQLDYDVVLYTRRSSQAVQRFDFGGSSFSPSPYVLSQLTGAYQSTPDFLDTKHPVETKADADAYLARLHAFADQLDGETGRLAHDVGMGIVPPDFIIELTVAQLRKLRVAPDQSKLVGSIARRAAVKGLGDGYGRDAARVYAERVAPALDRQIAAVETLRRTARPDAGIGTRPQGADFYRVALETTTTTALSPSEVHRFGLDQAAMISGRLDALLKAQGLTRGTVGERMAALAQDPAQLYADTEAGKAQAIAYCNARLDAIRGRLPRAFDRLPPYRFEVRRVPPETEAGAASAFSQGPAIDGSRPGLVYFNLRDTAEWPKFCLATTVFHEGLPGHQLEGGLALSNKELPLIRKASGFSGYAEGWALYAEQLADELGMYDDDPLGRLGYLKFQLFRANRCVVDTGLHAMGWTRERAIRHFVRQEGEVPGFAAREVERYCVQPGQACSYKLGHSVFVELRDRAKAALGPRFDLKRYHTAVLAPGRVPLDLLRQVGDRWIASGGA